MRLEILDRGHRLRTKALLGMIRLVSRQPVVDAVKLAFYRPNFYGGGDLTHEAMRGPSAWSIGDRERVAAFVSQANESPFCIAAHSTTSRLWYRDSAKVAATRRFGHGADRGAPAGDASHARQAHA
jgi:alkylhydroperoxidase family enzyme